jgi:hypothetical protein
VSNLLINICGVAIVGDSWPAEHLKLETKHPFEEHLSRHLPYAHSPPFPPLRRREGTFPRREKTFLGRSKLLLSFYHPPSPPGTYSLCTSAAAGTSSCTLPLLRFSPRIYSPSVTFFLYLFRGLQPRSFNPPRWSSSLAVVCLLFPLSTTQHRCSARACLRGDGRCGNSSLLISSESLPAGRCAAARPQPTCSPGSWHSRLHHCVVFLVASF